MVVRVDRLSSLYGFQYESGKCLVRLRPERAYTFPSHCFAPMTVAFPCVPRSNCFFETWWFFSLPPMLRLIYFYGVGE